MSFFDESYCNWLRWGESEFKLASHIFELWFTVRSLLDGSASSAAIGMLFIINFQILFSTNSFHFCFFSIQLLQKFNWKRFSINWKHFFGHFVEKKKDLWICIRLCGQKTTIRMEKFRRNMQMLRFYILTKSQNVIVPFLVFWNMHESSIASFFRKEK